MALAGNGLAVLSDPRLETRPTGSVWVSPALEAIRPAECLCLHCKPEAPCPGAGWLAAMQDKFGLTIAVSACPNWKPIPILRGQAEAVADEAVEPAYPEVRELLADAIVDRSSARLLEMRRDPARFPVQWTGVDEFLASV